MSTYTEKQTINQSGNNWSLITVAIVALIAIAAFVVWQVASPTATNPTTDGGAPTTLPAAIDVWEAQAVDSYSYDLQVICFCVPDMTRPVNIVVENGELQSVTYTDDGTAADTEMFAYYSTVEALFERLEDAQAQDPARFDVTFDAQYGVPQSVNIDISEMMADEELMFTVSDFTAMP